MLETSQTELLRLKKILDQALNKKFTEFEMT